MLRRLLRFRPSAVLSPVIFAFVPALLAADEPLVPNGDFQQGATSPEGWQLSTGAGQWKDRDLLTVTGQGDDTNYWRCNVQLEPNQLYRFRMRARRTSTGGSAIAGPVFANRDYAALTSEWASYSHVFRVPADVRDTYLRLGHWHANGTIEFDRVELTRVVPGFHQHENVSLGLGESIQDNRYLFLGMYGHEASNFHRPLEQFTAGFNSDRWTFGGNSQVTYRFHLPDNAFTEGHIALNVNYHTRGACVGEISLDGEAWQELVCQGEVGQAIATLPPDLLPAAQVYLRLRTAEAGDSFQVNRVAFTGTLASPLPNANGATCFAETTSPLSDIRLETMTLKGAIGSARQRLRVPIRNLGQRDLAGRFEAVVVQPDQQRVRISGGLSELKAGQVSMFDLELPRAIPGQHQLEFTLARSAEPAAALLSFTSEYTVADFYRVDYGARLPGSSASCDVWWCDSTRKVPRSRAAPDDTSEAVSLSAARNDRESVQIVVRANEGLQNLSAAVTPLRGPGGAVIDADRIQIRRVWYHFVTHPTDSTGVQDWWPDALPLLDHALDVPPDHNQPIWITVHVPKKAIAGDYRGTLKLRADGLELDVPLQLRVWDFQLPDRNHLETAFGMSAGNVFRYHNAQSDEERRRLLDMYFACFRDYRISPYDPAPLDRIRTKFVADADPPYAEVDFEAFDRAMTRAVEEFHFTGIRLPIQGMGGGTFHSRYPPEILGFDENSKEYRAMFSSYVGQLQQHFQQRGWLDLAYVYWFDEPAPRDYEFVTRGMQRLKQHAPRLRRMLTEEPNDALRAPVDIWCPVTYNFDPEQAARRQAMGERIWWYVCTGPKAPYCTLFIDHAATELRVWLWQTWKHNVQGILVWSSNYWTSSAAFPDEPQNPYLDPMGYVSGYSTPKGVKAFWGNGDGRFIYPPLAAATPSTSGGETVMAPPVPSIRWEMLREGIEDYEFLWLLRDLLNSRGSNLQKEKRAALQKLLSVPDAITKSMTEFTTDSTPIYQRRQQIAEAIEFLQQLE